MTPAMVLTGLGYLTNTKTTALPRGSNTIANTNKTTSRFKNQHLIAKAER